MAFLSLLSTKLGRLRVVAYMEGVSYLALLFVTMPLKYLAAMPQPNKVVGMAHGILFVLYLVAAADYGAQANWKARRWVLAFAASVVPFGTFWADGKVWPRREAMAKQARNANRP